MNLKIPATFEQRPYAAKHFAAIVSHVRDYHPFYRRWLADAGEVPIMDRQTFMAHNDEILNGHEVTCTTSGSSGHKVRVHQSAERVSLHQKDGAMFARWLGGYLPVTILVNPSSSGEGQSNFDIRMPLDEQLQLIQRRYRELGAVALTTYPGNAEILARTILEQGWDMSHIQRLGLYGESYEEHQAVYIRQAFPAAKIWTTYSSMEFGYISLMCPHQPSFQHLMAHRLGVEILDENDQPCPDGVRGRVVITDYFNRRCPFIRYDIGDFAVRGDCPCGKIALPALSQVQGRVMGSLIHRSGEYLNAFRVLMAIRDLPGVRRYQVVQEALESFVIKIECEDGVDADALNLKARALLALQDFLAYAPDEMRVDFVEEIPCGENGKYQYSICQVKK
ncbi:MAG: hypothetical protein L3J39_19525 [Verrucomicrobiales bacterium]|nr:hypothetical protein [Verrucomicrobiales bacterium]